ncbi:hypothetical protein LFWB_4420 [Candidatus Phytoplasma luffae]|uniref:RNA polymerase sigma-70 region 2 domain-containing protein n=1 Tax=Loofah witches'-broom phytoplasma TaxID=35773 RepID=A0A975IM37_LOWBP|nr:hypothetical protein [Candidatus Phytoplasma luffae]QTX02893.1 hypothetical protein LFWB_3230 [Candidatus Phytoplasma luffae]QTX03008.1 hypothetical protein LFWB_4420 [Candidatus Phytoplasma luffae]
MKKIKKYVDIIADVKKKLEFFLINKQEINSSINKNKELTKENEKLFDTIIYELEPLVKKFMTRIEKFPNFVKKEDLEQEGIFFAIKFLKNFDGNINYFFINMKTYIMKQIYNFLYNPISVHHKVDSEIILRNHKNEVIKDITFFADLSSEDGRIEAQQDFFDYTPTDPAKLYKRLVK